MLITSGAPCPPGVGLSFASAARLTLTTVGGGGAGAHPASQPSSPRTTTPTRQRPIKRPSRLNLLPLPLWERVGVRGPAATCRGIPIAPTTPRTQFPARQYSAPYCPRNARPRDVTHPQRRA